MHICLSAYRHPWIEFAAQGHAIQASTFHPFLLQVDTADELMTTELMFNAVWKQMSTAQLVALMSCLVPCNEKGGDDADTRLPLELAGAVGTLQETAGRICSITNVRPLHCRPHHTCFAAMRAAQQVSIQQNVTRDCSCASTCSGPRCAFILPCSRTALMLL